MKLTANSAHHYGALATKHDLIITEHAKQNNNFYAHVKYRWYFMDDVQFPSFINLILGWHRFRHLLYEKILEAPIWPVATQRIESAVSVWQGARCHWPLMPTLQDTQRAAIHSAARLTPPQQPSPSPTASAATPWMEWIRNVLLQPTHIGPGIPGYHTHILTPAHLSVLEPYAWHSAPRIYKLSGTSAKYFIVHLYFANYVIQLWLRGNSNEM